MLFVQGKSHLAQRPVTSSLWYLAGTPCQNLSGLNRVAQLVQCFSSSLVVFFPGMPKPVDNGSILVSCSVPLGLDNAAFPFLAYSGIPVVSFGFYNVSAV